MTQANKKTARSLNRTASVDAQFDPPPISSGVLENSEKLLHRVNSVLTRLDTVAQTISSFPESNQNAIHVVGDIRGLLEEAHRRLFDVEERVSQIEQGLGVPSLCRLN